MNLQFTTVHPLNDIPIPRIVHPMNASTLSDETRYKLFKLVEENPDMSQRELAKLMGISVGKLNYCLKALIDIGMIKMGNFARSQHKLGYVYILTPMGIAEKSKVTARFLARKEAEYEALEAELNSLRAEAEQMKSNKENK